MDGDIINVNRTLLGTTTEVIGEIKGEEAFDNIQALSNKYWNKPYPFPVQTERIVLKIEAEREFFFNLKDEDFDF